MPTRTRSTKARYASAHWPMRYGSWSPDDFTNEGRAEPPQGVDTEEAYRWKNDPPVDDRPRNRTPHTTLTADDYCAVVTYAFLRERITAQQTAGLASWLMRSYRRAHWAGAAPDQASTPQSFAFKYVTHSRDRLRQTVILLYTAIACATTDEPDAERYSVAILSDLLEALS